VRCFNDLPISRRNLFQAVLIAPMGLCAESADTLTPYQEANNIQYGLVKGWVGRSSVYSVMNAPFVFVSGTNVRRGCQGHTAV
jgi:hypothetical protein